MFPSIAASLYVWTWTDSQPQWSGLLVDLHIRHHSSFFSHLLPRDLLSHLWRLLLAPLLRCWWLRNCHNPFCIDAATVQAEQRRLTRRREKRKEGRPETHWKRRRNVTDGEMKERERERKREGQRNVSHCYTGISFGRVPLSPQSCVCPL